MPTAASEFVPSSRPTIIVSTMLYICWNRLPSRSGTEYKTMSESGLPTVMSLPADAIRPRR